MKICWGNFKKITNNFKKFKRKCKIILKLKELHSPDFTSYQMTNFYKFCPKQEILMLCKDICENVSIISIEFNSQMYSNQNKSSQWFQLNLKLCLKKWSSRQVCFLKALYKIGWWGFKRWWFNLYMIWLSKPWSNILMIIHFRDRTGFLHSMLKVFYWLILWSGLKD